MISLNYLLTSPSSSGSALSTSNESKITELTETLFSSLREALEGEDVLSFSMDEDQLSSVQAIMLRLALLGRSRDLGQGMDDEEGGQTAVREIVGGFVERGELGYKEEAKVSWFCKCLWLASLFRICLWSGP